MHAGTAATITVYAVIIGVMFAAAWPRIARQLAATRAPAHELPPHERPPAAAPGPPPATFRRFIPYRRVTGGPPWDLIPAGTPDEWTDADLAFLRGAGMQTGPHEPDTGRHQLDDNDDDQAPAPGAPPPDPADDPEAAWETLVSWARAPRMLP